MKLVASLAGVVAAVAIAVGAFAGIAGHGPLAFDEPPCEPPRMLLDSHRTAFMAKVDAYLDQSMSGELPPFRAKNPANISGVDWDVLAAPKTEPGRVEVVALVGEDWVPFAGPQRADTFDIVAVKDCAGGDWRIVKFKKQPSVADGGSTATGSSNG